MADELKNRGAADRSRVKVHEDHEVRYWTAKWGVSKERLVMRPRKPACPSRWSQGSWGKHERDGCRRFEHRTGGRSLRRSWQSHRRRAAEYEPCRAAGSLRTGEPDYDLGYLIAKTI